MIDAVLFDLDGTLLDRAASLRAFVRDQRRRLDHALGHIPLATYVTRFVELDADGTVWKDQVYRRLIEELGITQITAEALLEEYVSRFREHCVPFPNLHATLRELTASGLKLGIVSNGHDVMQMATVRALGIEGYFKTICISEREGLRKPDPTIFRRAVERLGSSVERAAFVGDNPVADVAGARNAGLCAIWRRDPVVLSLPEACAVVDDLGELPGVVRQLSINCLR